MDTPRLITVMALVLVAACGNDGDAPASSSGSVEGSNATAKDAGGTEAIGIAWIGSDGGPSVRDDMDAAVLDGGVPSDGAVSDAMALPMMVNDAEVRAGAGGVGGVGGVGGAGGVGGISGIGGLGGIGGMSGEGGTGGTFPQP